MMKWKFLYTRTYIKRDFRIVPYLLYDYLPIANMLGKDTGNIHQMKIIVTITTVTMDIILDDFKHRLELHYNIVTGI